MATFHHNGGDIHYTLQGEGDPIVLIHGFGLNSRVWEKHVDELSKTNRVITYDMRGFGKSSLPTCRYSHSEDLHELLKVLNVGDVKIVGHSFGGQVAVEYALKYPTEVGSLVLISPALSGVKGDTAEWEALAESGRQGDIEGLRKRMLDNPIFKNIPEGSEDMELVQNMIADYSGFHFTSRDPVAQESEGSKIRELSCSVDVVIGENDENTQKEVAKKFQEELGLEVREIPNASHMLVLEEPELICQIIKESGTKEYHAETSTLI